MCQVLNIILFAAVNSLTIAMKTEQLVRNIDVRNWYRFLALVSFSFGDDCDSGFIFYLIFDHPRSIVVHYIISVLSVPCRPTLSVCLSV